MKANEHFFLYRGAPGEKGSPGPKGDQGTKGDPGEQVSDFKGPVSKYLYAYLFPLIRIKVFNTIICNLGTSYLLILIFKIFLSDSKRC